MSPLARQDVHARLNLPLPLERPVLPRAPSTPAIGAARLAYQRRWIARLGAGGGSAGGTTSVAPPDRVRRDPVLTLVQRVTNGFSLAEYERAKALGYEAYLEEQLHPESIDDSELELRVRRYTSLEMSPWEVHRGFHLYPTNAYLQFKGAHLARATNSKRQLFERMCEFWSDHLNVDHQKGLEWVLMPEHYRTVIRPHALGTFPALLSASAFSGAMLYYLDNWLNVRGAPQENYARELLELHTLSASGGYNESDVHEVAKCFTGWTLVENPNSPDWLRARYDPALHTPGKKYVLGRTIPEGRPHAGPGHAPGQDEAQAVLDVLCAHPSTARFLARKLLIRFLTPEPSQALVERVAQVYVDTQGDVRALLRTILARENLGVTSLDCRPTFRRPFSFVVSLLRAFGCVVDNGNEVMTYLGELGQVPFDCSQPTGFPDGVDRWGPLVLPRWRVASLLMQPNFGSLRGLYFTVSLAPLLEVSLPDHGMRGLAERMNARVFGSALAPHEEELVQDFIDNYPASFDETALFDALCLATTLHGFQWN